jgi:serine/threonine-protein kinase
VAGLDALVGKTLGDTYQLVRVIGRGGMGAIYEAQHARLAGKRYAIKFLAPQFAENPELLARFRREAEIASQLGHEHIVEVHDFNVADGQAYLVMELLDGEDLAARLAARGPLGLEAMEHIVAQLASALDAAHRAHVVHRDLKPQNIYLCRRDGRDDYVKVLDFGISKVLDSASVVTRDHALIGTPFYMSPEQAEGHITEIDARTDVFALGAIIWETLTGRMAFGAPSFSVALYKVCFVDPPEVHLLRADVPAAVSMVLRRALAKERSLRTPSVMEVATELRAALRGEMPAGVPPPAAGGTGSVAGLSSLGSASTGLGVVAASPHAGQAQVFAAVTPPASVAPLASVAPSAAPLASIPSRPSPTPPPPPPSLGATPAPPQLGTGSVPDAGAAPALATGSVAQSQAADARAPRSRARWIAGGVAVVAAVAAGALAWTWTRRDAVPAPAPPKIEVKAAAPTPAPPTAPRVPDVALIFAVAPPDAVVDLRLDGEPVTKRRARVPQSSTPHVVTAEAKGFAPFRVSVVADQDQTIAVTLKRPKGSAHADPAPGKAPLAWPEPPVAASPPTGATVVPPPSASSPPPATPVAPPVEPLAPAPPAPAAERPKEPEKPPPQQQPPQQPQPRHTGTIFDP